MNIAPDSGERVRAFHARTLVYRRLGHDRIAAARFVVETAGALRGPALDVGTGKGLLAIALAQAGMEVVSVDVDGEEQELARFLAEEAGVGSRISFVHGDAACLSYPDDHFGCVAMMDVLHHLDEPVPVLREMTRVLGDTGLMVIADFDEQGFDVVARVHLEEGRVHPRTAATVTQAHGELLKAGLRRVVWATGCMHEVVVLRKKHGGARGFETSVRSSDE